MPAEIALSIDELEDALQPIAEWLISIYGGRLTTVALTLEGFYTPKRLFTNLFPEALFDRNSSHDVRDVARSGRVDPSCVTGHRRIQLLTRFGRPEIAGGQILERRASNAEPGG